MTAQGLKLTSKNRIEWIDELKGIGIIFVIWGHVIGGDISRYLFSFHMPLFFFLTGVVFHNQDFKVFFKKRAWHLFVPYFFFGVTTWIYWAFIEKNFRPVQNISIWRSLLNLLIVQPGRDSNGIDYFLQNNTLWFIPCLFFSSLLFLILYKISKAKIHVILPALIGFSILGFCLMRFLSFRLPWTLDIVPSAVAFIGLGFYFQKFLHSADLNRFSVKKMIFLAIAFLTVHIIFNNFLRDGVDLNMGILPNYFQFYGLAILGIITYFCFFYRLHISFFSKIGAYSLVIMLVHEPIKRVLAVVLAKILHLTTDAVRADVLLSIVLTIFILLVSILIAKFFEHFLPELAGMKRHIQPTKVSQN